MRYKALLEEEEVRLVTILPSSEENETIRCKIDHFNIGDLYHAEAFQQHRASPIGAQDDSRWSWVEYCKRQKNQELGDDWVDISPLADDATVHLPLPRYTWGDYLALSYTWGGSKAMQKIIVNDDPVLVTENLGQALHVLRDKHYIKDGWKLWIDALCINQKDIVERATQVKNMRNIYSKAWTPIIWLGPLADESDLAVELIRNLSTMQDERNAVTNLTAALRRDPKLFGEGRWRALHQFIVRRYWRRAWILQEASLGRDDMPVLCGQQTLPWIHIHRTFDLLNKSDEVINIYITKELEEAGLNLDILIWNGLFVAGEIHRLQAEQIEIKSINLYRVMSLSRNVNATDPRDKIYGLLAMISDNITSRIIPDYTAPVVDIYLDFAKLTIEATKSLEIIRHTSPHGNLGLPSWVPDWTAEHMLSSLTLSNTLHLTSGTSDPQVRFLRDRRLAVKGFKVDVFDGFGCLWREVPSGRGWPADTLIQSKYAANPYGTDAAIGEAIWRTMVADRDMYVEPLKEDYSSLLASSVILEAGADMTDEDPLKDVAGSNILDWSAKFVKGNAEFKICGKQMADYLPKTFEEVRSSVDAAVLRDALMARDRINVRRRLITTSRGFVGMALEEARLDDVIVVLLGCSMPMVLRPVQIGVETEYKIVGECYIHGIMKGEAMDWLREGECELEELVICEHP